MPFLYNQAFLEHGLSYDGYRHYLNDLLQKPAADETAEKMSHYIKKNIALMDVYDRSYEVTKPLLDAVEKAPATFWIVITEGWCGDAAFNVPLIAAIERLLPEKIELRFYLRDSNLELIDANLTDGGRSIPKVVILNKNMQEEGVWGPRPAGLQLLMKLWKTEGMQLKEMLPKIKEWYDDDATVSLQQELIALVKNYS